MNWKSPGVKFPSLVISNWDKCFNLKSYHERQMEKNALFSLKLLNDKLLAMFFIFSLRFDELLSWLDMVAQSVSLFFWLAWKITRIIKHGMFNISLNPLLPHDFKFQKWNDQDMVFTSEQYILVRYGCIMDLPLTFQNSWQLVIKLNDMIHKFGATNAQLHIE